MAIFTIKSNVLFSPLPQETSTFGYEDKRYLPRWEVNNRVVFRNDQEDAPHECSSKDINISGLCIRTSEKVEVHQKLVLTVYLSPEVHFSTNAIVLWKKPGEDENLIGLHFDGISEEIRDLIFKYAFEFKKNDFIKHWYKGF